MIHEIRRLFVGRDDTYVLQNNDGTYKRIDEPLTDEVISKHLKGDITIGIYQHDLNSFIKWVCFDFDENKSDALKVFEYLKSHEKYREACLLEDTGGRGAHVWLFFESPIPASVGRYLANEIVERLKVKCEVFPKQDKISEKGFGNQVKLPLGLHRKYGRFSMFLDPSSLNEIKPVSIPKEVIMEIEEFIKHKSEKDEVEKIIPTGLIPWWIECKAFDRIIYGNIEEGTRNECGFWISRLLRNSGFPSWMTEEVLLCWNRHLKCQPLPEKEIRTIVKSVYSKGYSIGKLSLKKNPETSVYCEGCVKNVCSKRKEKKERKSTLIKPYEVL
jgi:(2Fe-2S) ferredoxin